MRKTSNPSGIPPGTMAVLMLAVFTVSIGYGVVLPLLPYLIERLLDAGSARTQMSAQVSGATGLLTGIYTLALFLFAPMWGRMSDQHGRRVILLAGLTGFGVTTLVFSLFENLAGLYAERFLSGLFAAAVTPVALAVIADLATSEEARARRLTFVSLAGISGFLLGPMVGVFLAGGVSSVRADPTTAASLTIPLAATAILAVLAAAAVFFTVSGEKPREAVTKGGSRDANIPVWLLPRLLALAFVVSAGVGVFEVGLALRGKQELGLTQFQIAAMFMECSLVMLVAQAIVFSPWVNPEATRWLIAPALAVLAAGLFLVPYASNFMLMLAVVGAVAASAGVLSPILTYWVSSKAGAAQGAALGKQTAAASLGVTVGSAAGGLLFDIALLPNASFVLMTVLIVLGFFVSLSLPSLLVTRKLGPSVPVTQP